MTELTVESNDGTVVLTINRPEKMNALSSGLVEALFGRIVAAYCDNIRVLVLKANGRNFSTGFDFTGYEEQSEGDLVLRFVRIEQLLQAIYYAPFETLALAHGQNFGAGVDVICACSRRIAAPGSTFRMPGLRFGIILGTRRFAERVGSERARHILQSNQLIDAASALSSGFLHDVVPQDSWPDVIDKTARVSRSLEAASATRLFEVTRTDTRDQDLADIVRSAARPGIKQRISAYLQQTEAWASKARTMEGRTP